MAISYKICWVYCFPLSYPKWTVILLGFLNIIEISPSLDGSQEGFAQCRFSHNELHGPDRSPPSCVLSSLLTFAFCYLLQSPTSPNDNWQQLMLPNSTKRFNDTVEIQSKWSCKHKEMQIWEKSGTCFWYSGQHRSRGVASRSQDGHTGQCKVWLTSHIFRLLAGNSSVHALRLVLLWNHSI